MQNGRGMAQEAVMDGFERGKRVDETRGANMIVDLQGETAPAENGRGARPFRAGSHLPPLRIISPLLAAQSDGVLLEIGPPENFSISGKYWKGPLLKT
jgi:hypothetical protein